MPVPLAFRVQAVASAPPPLCGDLLAQVQLRCDVVVGDRAGGLAADADGDLVLVGAGALAAADAAPVRGRVAGGAAGLRQRPGVGQQRAVGVDRGRAREVVGAGAVGVQGPGRGERTAAVVVGDLLAQVQLRCDVVVGDRAGGLAADADGDLVLVGAGALAAADAAPVRGRVAGGAACLRQRPGVGPAACRRSRPGSSPTGRWCRCRWRSGSRPWRAHRRRCRW